MGADSAGVSGLNLRTRTDPKVFQLGGLLCGFTTSFRMGQLLRWKWQIPARPEKQSMDEYLATALVDSIRQCFKDGGFAEKKNEQESGGTFLIACEGRLFTIHDDYQVAETSDDFAAVGCGDEYALGALHALRDHRRTEQHVRVALEAAEHFSAGVRGPFLIQSLAK